MNEVLTPHVIFMSDVPDDLKRVIEVWGGDLPEAVRMGIVAMVGAASHKPIVADLGNGVKQHSAAATVPTTALINEMLEGLCCIPLPI